MPLLTLPKERGAITAVQVLETAAGVDRDAAIGEWCRSVWTACSANREAIIALLREYRLAQPALF